MTTMPDPARPEKGIVAGIDTHAEFHVVAALDHLGALLGTATFPATTKGYTQLQHWLSRHGPILAVGIEGTSSYGTGITRHLHTIGITVHEINRPDRSTRRRLGKTDTIDAEAAARTVLSGRALPIPKTHDGPIEAIRVLHIARRSAIRARTQAANQITALIGTAHEPLRNELRDLTGSTRINTCAQYQPDEPGPDHTTRYTLATLARRWQHLDHEISQLDKQLGQIVPTAAGTLLEVFGVGIHTAATLLITAGDNPDRMHTEAAFAALCGVNPIPASSGKTHRHRLNRGGNRQANHALWRITIVRLAHHQPTRDYAQRRTQTGNTKPEIIRLLKRYIAREIYPHLKPPTRP